MMPKLDSSISPPGGSTARTSLQIVEALGLGDRIDIVELAERRSAFKAVHMGENDLAIGTLLDLVKSDAALCPPRTGHIGNWGNIALGRAGAMDFNKAICAPGYGYPLLYCFTQTEADVSRQGDWGYLPGSIVDRDERRPLPLHAWDGRRFVYCGNAQPRFTPFVQAEVDGQLQPLTQLHTARMRQIEGFNFRLEQALIAEQDALVRPLLTALVADACRRNNSRRALQDLVSHAVELDGTLTRSAIERDGAGFQLGDCRFASIDTLVEGALAPFHAVASPAHFMDLIGSLPRRLPLLSNLTIAVLSAMIETHLPDAARNSGRSRGPINPHLHWGGRDMAGYPPLRKGYLFEEAKIKSMRRMCSTLVAEFAQIDPLCFVLLPAPVFMLCPTNAHPRDAELLADLIHQIQSTTAGTVRSSAELQQAISDAARRWHGTAGSELSAYFRERFGPRRGGLLSGERPDASEPVEPGGFRNLSLRHASMIIGALFEIEGSRSPMP